jgi:hypothetical protein
LIRSCGDFSMSTYSSADILAPAQQILALYCFRELEVL